MPAEKSPIEIVRSHLALRTQLLALSRSQRAAWMAEQLRQHPETASEVALLLDELSADLKAERPQPSERNRKLPPPMMPGEYQEETHSLYSGTIAQLVAQMEADDIPLTADISASLNYGDLMIEASWLRPLTEEEKRERQARFDNRMLGRREM